MPGAASGARTQDQARLPVFRGLLLLQLVVTLVLGLGTFLVPGIVAALGGYTGHEHFYYRLGGAATLGYGAAAFFALRENALWEQVRIPVAATVTFNLAALLASLLSLGDGDRQWPVFFVLVAATAFSILAAYWLLRNQGTPSDDARRIDSTFRWVIVVATAAAAFFGLVPLLFARPLASATGFSTDDLFILRQASAATLGYAVGGVLLLQTAQWGAIRLQVVGAIVFNGLSVIAAALYLLAGGRSPVGALLLLAAAAFTAALTWGLRRGERSA